MTKYEMRIAIAGKCGLYGLHGTSDENKIPGRKELLPNYPEDLNACYNMEEVLTESERMEYCYQFHLMFSPDRGTHFTTKTFSLVHLTAAQRCEAFCRVLWPERFSEKE